MRAARPCGSCSMGCTRWRTGTGRGSSCSACGLSAARSRGGGAVTCCWPSAGGTEVALPLRLLAVVAPQGMHLSQVPQQQQQQQLLLPACSPTVTVFVRLHHEGIVNVPCARRARLVHGHDCASGLLTSRACGSHGCCGSLPAGVSPAGAVTERLRRRNSWLAPEAPCPLAASSITACPCCLIPHAWFSLAHTCPTRLAA